ncbi:LysR family transcriptional regulator, partial [Burkholderia contaminans]|uniref:LysR family transcriptional regulator n=1 Tax=Burkholderia contaminans TaxID=488447 RepID=UPI0021BBBA06
MDDFLSPHLALFVDVVDQQSFSAAARRLGVAASSVTRRIDRLETQFGIRLLHRTTHALRPTEAGQLLYGRATRMLAELRGLQEDLHSQHDEPSGLLRVDCPAPFGRRHLMAALAAFMPRPPARPVGLVVAGRPVSFTHLRAPRPEWDGGWAGWGGKKKG